MKILVVDNGGQWTHREWRVLRELGIDSEIVSNTSPLSLISSADGIVLSGGAPRLSSELKLGNTSEYIDNLSCPILGICVGHQYIALHFKGHIAPASVPEFGRTICYIDNPSPIFKDLPESFQVWESHNDEVSLLPDCLISLAHSEHCRVQALMHKRRAIYGLQFHPEVEHTEHGRKIFQNFIDICRGIK